MQVSASDALSNPSTVGSTAHASVRTAGPASVARKSHLPSFAQLLGEMRTLPGDEQAFLSRPDGEHGDVPARSEAQVAQGEASEAENAANPVRGQVQPATKTEAAKSGTSDKGAVTAAQAALRHKLPGDVPSVAALDVHTDAFAVSSIPDHTLARRASHHDKAEDAQHDEKGEGARRVKTENSIPAAGPLLHVVANVLQVPEQEIRPLPVSGNGERLTAPSPHADEHATIQSLPPGHAAFEGDAKENLHGSSFAEDAAEKVVDPARVKQAQDADVLQQATQASTQEQSSMAALHKAQADSLRSAMQPLESGAPANGEAMLHTAGARSVDGAALRSSARGREIETKDAGLTGPREVSGTAVDRPAPLSTIAGVFPQSGMASNGEPSADTKGQSQQGNVFHDPFQKMDAGGAPPTMLHASAHEVAVGIRDPELGWIEVRTQSSSGNLNASLTATSTEAHAALAAQLPSMTQYLADREVAVHSVSVGTHTGQGGQDAGSQPQSQYQASAQAQSSRAASAGSSGRPAAVEQAVIPETRTSGQATASLISVRA